MSLRIENYLANVELALWKERVSELTTKEMLKHLKAHLEDTTQELIKEGLSLETAEEKAIERCGVVEGFATEVKRGDAPTLARKFQITKVILFALYPGAQYWFAMISRDSMSERLFGGLYLIITALFSFMSTRWIPKWYGIALIPCWVLLTLTAWYRIKENSDSYYLAWNHSFQSKTAKDLEKIRNVSYLLGEEYKSLEDNSEYQLKRNGITKFHLLDLSPDLDDVFLSKTNVLKKNQIGFSYGIPASYKEAKISWEQTYPELAYSLGKLDPEMYDLRYSDTRLIQSILTDSLPVVGGICVFAITLDYICSALGKRVFILRKRKYRVYAE